MELKGAAGEKLEDRRTRCSKPNLVARVLNDRLGRERTVAAGIERGLDDMISGRVASRDEAGLPFIHARREWSTKARPAEPSRK